MKQTTSQLVNSSQLEHCHISIRKLVKDACRKYSFEQLINKIGSKGSENKYVKLKPSSYLKGKEKMTINQCKLLFKLRSRMLNVKNNFKNNYITNSIKLPEAIYCSFCLSNSVEDQEPIIDCEAFEQPYKVKYADLFSQDIKIVAENIRKYEAIWKQRCEETNTTI